MTATANVQTEAMEVNPAVVSIPDEIRMTENRESLQKAIDQISSNKLKELLEREKELKAEIDDLSAIDSEMNADRISALETDLGSTRAEIAKRGEDLASLSFAIAGEMEAFGRLSGDALQDNAEDIARKEGAYSAIEEAENNLIDAKASLESAETDFKKAKEKEARLSADLAEAETELQTQESSSWWGRKKRIQTAQDELAGVQRNSRTAVSDTQSVESRIEQANQQIENAENCLETAKNELPVILEQIEVDKRNRIKEASLEETYAMITKWVTQAKDVLKEDIGEYLTRIKETHDARKAAIDRREEAAQRIKKAKENLNDLDMDFQEVKLRRDDITDKTDPEYQSLTTEMEELAVKLDAAKNEKQLAESNFSDSEIAVKERIQSIQALTAQCELAKLQFNKFVMNEETAHYIGQNIEVLVKGTTREALNESLDKGVQKMTIAVFDVALKTQVASVKQLNDMGERKINLLKLMDEMEGEKNHALAEQAERYESIAEQFKKDLGLDVDNMPGLNAAAEMISSVSEVKFDPAKAETEMF